MLYTGSPFADDDDDDDDGDVDDDDDGRDIALPVFLRSGLLYTGSAPSPLAVVGLSMTVGCLPEDCCDGMVGRRSGLL